MNKTVGKLGYQETGFISYFIYLKSSCGGLHDGNHCKVSDNKYTPVWRLLQHLHAFERGFFVVVFVLFCFVLFFVCVCVFLCFLFLFLFCFFVLFVFLLVFFV